MQMANGFAQAISTHAPRTGSDLNKPSLMHVSFHFNPRSPHGERREVSKRLCGHDYFNPRSPHGERRRTGRFAASRS